MKRKFLLTATFAAFGMMLDSANAMGWRGEDERPMQSGQPRQSVPPTEQPMQMGIDRIAAQMPSFDTEYLARYEAAALAPASDNELVQRLEALREENQNVRGATVERLDSMKDARRTVVDLLETENYGEVDDYCSGTGANALGFADLESADVSTLRKASDGLKQEAAGAPKLSDLGGIEYVCMAITGSPSARIEGLTSRNYKRLAFMSQISAYDSRKDNRARNEEYAEKARRLAANPNAVHGRGNINNVYLLIAALSNIVHRIDSSGVPVRFGSDSLGIINPYDGDRLRAKVVEAIKTLQAIVRSVPTPGEEPHRGSHYHRYGQGGAGSGPSSSSSTSEMPYAGSHSQYGYNGYHRYGQGGAGSGPSSSSSTSEMPYAGSYTHYGYNGYYRDGQGGAGSSSSSSSSTSETPHGGSHSHYGYNGYYRYGQGGAGSSSSSSSSTSETPHVGSRTHYGRNGYNY